MTEEGFWRSKTRLRKSGTSPTEIAKMQSFCRLQNASTVNNFSSEKKMTSVVCVPSFNLFRGIFARDNLFSFWRSVRWWEVCNLRGDMLSSVLTTLLIVGSLTSISRAIFLMDLFGLGVTRARTFFLAFESKQFVVFHFEDDLKYCQVL